MDLANQLLDSASHLSEFRDQTSSGAKLGVSHIPSTMLERYGQPAAGVKRTALNLALKQLLIDNDIEIHEGWKLEDIEEKEDEVIASFEGGRRAEGSFLIGSDGIKAASRGLLMKRNGIAEGVPAYTGLTQVKSPYLSQDCQRC